MLVTLHWIFDEYKNTGYYLYVDAFLFYHFADKDRSELVTLRLTVSESVCLGVEPTLWTFDQTLLPFQEFYPGS
jgi:hypothetical protein